MNYRGDWSVFRVGVSGEILAYFLIENVVRGRVDRSGGGSGGMCGEFDVGIGIESNWAYAWRSAAMGRFLGFGDRGAVTMEWGWHYFAERFPHVGLAV